MTAPERIVGRFIFDISVRVQGLEAFVVSRLGTDLAYAHDLVARDADRVAEAVAVPELEQGNIKADVGGVQQPVLGHFVKEAGEVLDVIHGELL